MTTNERIALWLLTRCCADRVALKTVLYEESALRNQWNDNTTNMDGWSKSRIREVLLSLATDGKVQFWQGAWHNRVPLRKLEVEKVVKLEDEAIDKAAICFGLTKSGSRDWETYFKPPWSAFHRIRVTDNKVLIVCASIAQRYEMLGSCMDFMGWDKEFGLRNVRTGSSRKWQATYWKILKHGYYARATISDCDEEPIRSAYLNRLFVPWEKYFVVP